MKDNDTIQILKIKFACQLPLKDGAFQEPVKLGGGVNHPVNGIHPFIDANEKFILFDCYRNESFGGEGDLYVSFKKMKTWSGAMLIIQEEI